MATYDSLVKEVLPYVPGCPDSLVINHLRAATIETCEKSKAYVQDLDPISTVAGVLNMILISPPVLMYIGFCG